MKNIFKSIFVTLLFTFSCTSHKTDLISNFNEFETFLKNEKNIDIKKIAKMKKYYIEEEYEWSSFIDDEDAIYEVINELKLESSHLKNQIFLKLKQGMNDNCLKKQKTNSKLSGANDLPKLKQKKKKIINSFLKILSEIYDFRTQVLFSMIIKNHPNKIVKLFRNFKTLYFDYTEIIKQANIVILESILDIKNPIKLSIANIEKYYCIATKLQTKLKINYYQLFEMDDKGFSYDVNYIKFHNIVQENFCGILKKNYCINDLNFLIKTLTNKYIDIDIKYKGNEDFHLIFYKCLKKTYYINHCCKNCIKFFESKYKYNVDCTKFGICKLANIKLFKFCKVKAKNNKLILNFWNQDMNNLKFNTYSLTFNADTDQSLVFPYFDIGQNKIDINLLQPLFDKIFETLIYFYSDIIYKYIIFKFIPLPKEMEILHKEIYSTINDNPLNIDINIEIIKDYNISIYKKILKPILNFKTNKIQYKKNLKLLLSGYTRKSFNGDFNFIPYLIFNLIQKYSLNAFLKCRLNITST